eukprot:CAMPEP_0179037204 /NCGR_PEP_ID=MMETSP0796-20121207/14009_1 /TAXON_ID=73915 /ORGANISM="Pyrodinium bahamense, Strain pbaha01" /LENGTH=588 /DNA_ID=CAMNT_0020733507 /DNA_START=76 /DNA_END=1838 /DNA_ORIENTATION=-
MAPIHALLLWGLHHVTGTDVESMIQHSFKAQASLAVGEPTGSPFETIMSRRMSEFNVTRGVLLKAMEREVPLMKEQASLKTAVGNFLREAVKTLKDSHDRLQDGLKDLADNSSNSTVEGLLTRGEAFFRQSGALDKLKTMAKGEWERFAMSGPIFDSYVFGFEIPKLAPSLVEEHTAITGATARIFANIDFKGSDVRICVNAGAQADPNAGWMSQFLKETGKEKEKERKKLYEILPRINPFVGVARWKNLPGWSFGAQAFLNFPFIGPSDLGWKWTLSKEPETACYFFDICTAGCNLLKVHQPPSALQTEGEVVADEALEAEGGLDTEGVVNWPIRVPTFVEHTWCTEDLDSSDEEAICYTDFGEEVSIRCITGDGHWYSVEDDWPVHKCDDSTCIFRCLANGTAFYSDLGTSYGWGKLHTCRSKDYKANYTTTPMPPMAGRGLPSSGRVPAPAPPPPPPPAGQSPFAAWPDDVTTTATSTTTTTTVTSTTTTATSTTTTATSTTTTTTTATSTTTTTTETSTTTTTTATSTTTTATSTTTTATSTTTTATSTTTTATSTTTTATSTTTTTITATSTTTTTITATSTT